MAIKKKSKSKPSEETKKSSSKSKSSKKLSKDKTEKKTKPKKEKTYGVFKEEYKGSPVIAVRETNEDGEPTDNPYPIISAGLRKWKIILEHLPEIEEILDSISEED